MRSWLLPALLAALLALDTRQPLLPRILWGTSQSISIAASKSGARPSMSTISWIWPRSRPSRSARRSIATAMARCAMPKARPTWRSRSRPDRLACSCSAGGAALNLRPVAQSLSFPAGQGGLVTMRLTAGYGGARRAWAVAAGVRLCRSELRRSSGLARDRRAAARWRGAQCCDRANQRPERRALHLPRSNT